MRKWTAAEIEEARRRGWESLKREAAERNAIVSQFYLFCPCGFQANEEMTRGEAKEPRPCPRCANRLAVNRARD